MFSSTDLYSSATKSYFESQLALVTALTEITYHSTAKMLELELNTTKGTMAEIELASKKMSEIKTSQEWTEFVTHFTQLNLIRSLEFTRHAAKIGATAMHEYAEVMDKELKSNGKKVKELVDDAVKHAPGSTPQSVNFLNSLIDTTNASYAQLAKVAQDSVHAFEENLISVTGKVEKDLEKGFAQNSAQNKQANAKQPAKSN
jgi:hypothetical protein